MYLWAPAKVRGCISWPPCLPPSLSDSRQRQTEDLITTEWYVFHNAGLCFSVRRESSATSCLITWTTLWLISPRRRKRKVCVSLYLSLPSESLYLPNSANKGYNRGVISKREEKGMSLALSHSPSAHLQEWEIRTRAWETVELVNPAQHNRPPCCLLFLSLSWESCTDGIISRFDQ